jgi:putative toxin-antitoxin system antitoxin component (TIGR02293 family)
METNLNLGGYLGVVPASDFDLAEMVEKGLPTDRLALLRQKGLTAGEISEIVVPARTLKHRKARREPLSHEETDRLVRVARTLALAEGVFGDPGKSLLWLRTADDHIGGRTPLSMLATDAGGRLVEGLLWQIDEGVYS